MTSEERGADTAERHTTDTEGYKLRTMHFDDNRWERMRSAAKKDGRSISGWLRALVDKVLTKKLR